MNESRSREGTEARVDVAAGVLQLGDGRYLLAERPAGKYLGGYLEFPGGKLETGETPEVALARELDEELGVAVTVTQPLVQFEHAYPDYLVRAYMFRVTDWEGEPHGREGQRLLYAAPEALHSLPLLPANRPILAALELPDQLLVTPPHAWRNRDEFLVRFERSLRTARPGAAIIRPCDAVVTASMASRLAIVAERENCLLMLSSGEICRPPPGFAGLHLPATALMRLDSRPEEVGRVGASVHNEAEARHAQALGLDYVIAGSVRETPSHPGITPLGWKGFDVLVRAAGIPVYAIGGMAPADVPEVRRHWGQGIAAIRALWNHRA